MSSEIPQYTRREALITLGGRVLTAGVIAATPITLLEKTHRIPEALTQDHSEFILSPDQAAYARKHGSLCLVFGGQTVKSSENVVKALLPSLQPLGGVAAIRMADQGLDSKSIAKQILRSGYRDLSIFGLSSGTQYAEDVLSYIWDEVKLRQLIMAETPVSMDFVASSLAEPLAQYDADSQLFTWLANLNNYGNLSGPTESSPGDNGAQLQLLLDGERRVKNLAAKADHDGTKVSFLTLADQTKDKVTKAAGSEARMRQLFPGLRVVGIGGKQEHSIPDKNADAYNTAVRTAIATKVSRS